MIYCINSFLASEESELTGIVLIILCSDIGYIPFWANEDCIVSVEGQINWWDIIELLPWICIPNSRCEGNWWVDDWETCNIGFIGGCCIVEGILCY